MQPSYSPYGTQPSPSDPPPVLFNKICQLLNLIASALGVSGSSPGTGPGVPANPAYVFGDSIVIVGAKVCYSISGYSTNGSAQYIMLFDSASVPANGATPIEQIKAFPDSAGNSGAFSWDFGARGLQFANGICAVNSTTGGTLTKGAADTFFLTAYL